MEGDHYYEICLCFNKHYSHMDSYNIDNYIFKLQGEYINNNSSNYDCYIIRNRFWRQKMKRSLMFPLSYQLAKIYFSNVNNKDYLYRKKLFYFLENLGGVYVKFLQILCSIDDFMKGWGSPKELEVFNKVKTEKIDLSKYLNIDDFSIIEEKPFASGSFAQIYKAKLKTGEIVALKILRPSICKTLKQDLKKLKKLIKIFNNFLPNTFIDYKKILEEFCDNCQLETNYKREIANMKYFYKLYEKHRYVVIPKVYEHLSTDKLIVQEFIEGPTLADLLTQVTTKASLEDLVEKQVSSNIWNQIIIVGGEALRTAMTCDYVYGDPHPGNIILLKNNKVALVDFGIVANKPISQKAFHNWVKSYYDILKGENKYNELLENTYYCFCPNIANALEKCTNNKSITKTISDELMKKINIIERTNEKAKNYKENGHILKLLFNSLENKNSLNLELDIRNYQLLKAMQAFLSSVTTIDNKDGSHRFSNLMIKCMEYSFFFCNKYGVKNDNIYKSKYTINQSYELLLEMLTSLAEADEYLFKNISERML